MSDLTLLSISGALRAASTNRLLLAEARRLFGPATHVEANLRLPLYDGDIEAVAGGREVDPLDDELLESLARNHDLLVTVEDNVLQGGFQKLHQLSKQLLIQLKKTVYLHDVLQLH